MLPFYVFAAVLGGGLLLVSMMGGDSDVADADVDVDGGSWTKFFSVRTWSYVLAAFGLTGAALTLLGTAASLVLLISALMGLFGGIGASLLFGWIVTTQGGFSESSQSYIGGIGRTEVRIPADGRGRVQLVHRGRTFTMPATSVEGEIAREEAVIVVDVVDGVAVVGRAPRELTA